jgi:hypothetical protein
MAVETDRLNAFLGRFVSDLGPRWRRAAGDTVADNLNPVGRVYYNFSTYLCLPNALSEPGGSARAQAGEAAIREVVTAPGFTRFRRAAETPFDLVYEARP